MKKILVAACVALVFAMPALADVTLSEKLSLQKGLKAGKDAAKAARNHGALGGPVASGIKSPHATGSVSFVDSSNLEWFINTDITFATSSSASAANSEASYTGPVSATTSLGGTTSSTLNDAFDGYNTLCLSTTGATGPCTTGDANYTVYNQNGPATLDATCANRQVNFPAKTVGSFSVSRKVYVPTTDQFERALNYVTNTSGATASINLITANNLGSDANTVLVTTSSGDATATISDTWASSFQNYSGTTSSDVRLGHVFRGASGPVGLASMNFVNGDDNPYWAYSLTLNPGQTAIVAHFATGQPSKAAAATKAAQLAGSSNGNDAQWACMSQTEKGQVVNFSLSTQNVVEVPTVSEVGLASLAGLLLTGGFLLLRRRAA